MTHSIHWPLALVVFCLSAQAGAQGSWSTDPQAVQSAKDAKARYEADKRLCADEASADARLQCRRDASTVYDRALAKLRTQGAPAVTQGAPTAAPAASAPQGTYSTKPAAACADCGRVSAVSVAEKAGESNPVGLIAGGVAGAVLGHQVGGGFGKDLATIAGAAGGAYAGKKIQENMGASKVWTVSVTYTDGRSAKFDFDRDPGFQVGDKVKNAGTTLVRN